MPACGSLVGYFPSKRAFFAAIVEEEGAKLLRASTPDLSLPPFDQIKAGPEVYIDHAEHFPDGYRMAHQAVITDARGRLREGLAWFDAALADLDAQHAEVAAGVRSRALADRAMLAIWDATACLRLSEPSRSRARSMTRPYGPEPFGPVPRTEKPFWTTAFWAPRVPNQRPSFSHV